MRKNLHYEWVCSGSGGTLLSLGTQTGAMDGRECDSPQSLTICSKKGSTMVLAIARA